MWQAEGFPQAVSPKTPVKPPLTGLALRCRLNQGTRLNGGPPWTVNF